MRDFPGLRITVSRFGHDHLRSKRDAEKGAAVAIPLGQLGAVRSRFMTDITPERANASPYLTPVLSTYARNDQPRWEAENRRVAPPIG